MPSILISSSEFTWNGRFSGIVSPGGDGTMSRLPSSPRSDTGFPEKTGSHLPEGILDLIYPDSTFIGHLEALHYLNFTDR